MKLLNVKLNNIGLYKNEEISFSFNGKKDIILFWGNNGAGKTTLINSIKIGFLGKDAFQMSYSEYCEYIKENIITTRRNSDKIEASIQISFTHNENNNIVNYVLVRLWNIDGDIIEENVDVYKNDKKLDFDEKENTIKMISSVMPPSLLDVIIFDGENAINVLNNDKMSMLIKSIVYSVFGMEVYVNLSKDINAFLRSGKSNSNTNTDDSVSFIRVENDYKKYVSDVKKLQELISLEKEKATSLTREIAYFTKRFKEKTGVEIDDVSSVDSIFDKAKNQKEKADADIRYIYEEILPLKMLHARLIDVINKIENEKPYIALKNINDLKKYFSDSKGALKLLKDLEKYIPDESSTFEYDLSDVEYNTLVNTSSILKQYNKKDILESIEKREGYFQNVKDQLSRVKKITDRESQSIFEKLTSLYENLEEVMNSIDSLQVEQQKSINDLEAIKCEYELKKETLKKQKKESNSYITALKYRVAIDEFVSNNISLICNNLNSKISGDLRKMKFRNDSIGKIVISPSTFEMSLYEKSGNLIPSSLFSAGEKQVLLGLVIKNSLLLSNNDTFFLFDTPVGRLDKENRKIFTNEVIFNVSDQVAIFATDSDYTSKDYNLIKKQITGEAILKRDKNDYITIEKGSIYSRKTV